MAFVFAAGDLRAFCRTGPRLSFNGVTTYADDGSPIQGLLDETVEAKLEDNGAGGVFVRHLAVHVPFNVWNPMPAIKDTLIVDGVPYTVGDLRAEDDGAFTAYYLKISQP